MYVSRKIFGASLRRALLSLTLGAVASLSSAGPIDYYVNQTIGAGSVTGYIETDGTIGVLGPANIDGWNLLLNDGTTTWTLPQGTFFPFTGSDLSATATQLLFNFSGTDGGVFDISDGSLDFNVCFSAANGACWGNNGGGETIVFRVPYDQNNQFSALSGTQPIASMTLTPLQGGGHTTPIFIPNSLNGAGGIFGTIGPYPSQSYYEFDWGGGAFSATASVNGVTNAGASYLFSETVYAANSCGSAGGSTTLNSGDDFSGTIAIPNLAAGQYCVGVDANNSSDPGIVLTFNTPVDGSIPEPSTLGLLFAGLSAVSVVRFVRRTPRK
jgi:hypothetical protein